MSKSRSENPIKKFILLWVWRVQQIGAISTLFITAINLSLTVAALVWWRIGNTFVAVMMSFVILASVIMTLGWVWDKKAQMWKEQNVINVERNPFYKHKMTPKEVLSFTHIWNPLLKTVGNILELVIQRDAHAEPSDVDKDILKQARQLKETADAWERWCTDQNSKDPILAASVKELRDAYFKGE